MNIKKLTTDISVSEQIKVEDVQTIRDAGYKTIVCHRPDDEAGDHVKFNEINALSKNLGLNSVYQPVISGKISDRDVDNFRSIIAQSPAPIFAYCRTGARSTTLWSLAKANELSIAKILATSQAAGYDMSGIIQRIINGNSDVAE